MSPKTKTRRDGTVRLARYRSLQWPTLIWLTLVWLALWRSFTVLNVIVGLLVAVGVCLLFPMPPLRMRMRIRPLATLWLVLHFLWDVVVSSVEVAWVVLRPRKAVRNAIVEVNLETPSDFVLTLVAEMTCLVPGSLVVEARRTTHTLYLHVLDVVDEAGVEKFRRRVLAQEQRVLRALGTGPTDPRPSAVEVSA